jgi:PilZ domain-containing protein
MTLHLQAEQSRFVHGHKRVESRARLAIEARLQTVYGRLSGYLLNLSCHGAMVQTTEPPARGAYVVITCGPLDILGTVVWLEHERFGLEFDEPIAEELVIELRDLADEAARQAACERAGRRTLVTRPLTTEEWKLAQDWMRSSGWR